MEANWRKNYLRYKSFFLNMLSQYRERSDWRAYLEILLSLATISVFSIFALKPTVLTIAGLIKQIDEKEATLQKMENKIQNLSKAQILYDRERGNIEILEQTVIPKNSSSDVFARQIEALSTKHQLSISSFSLGSSSLNKVQTLPIEENAQLDNPLGYSNLDFSLNFKTDVNNYQSANNFLGDFRNLRRIPVINRLEFKISNSKEGEVSDLDMTISGQLPYLP